LSVNQTENVFDELDLAALGLERQLALEVDVRIFPPRLQFEDQALCAELRRAADKVTAGSQIPGSPEPRWESVLGRSPNTL